jgi:hypothetical protein
MLNRLAIAGAATIGVLLIAAAPNLFSRLTAIFVVAMLTWIAIGSYRLLKARLRLLDVGFKQVEESMERMATLAEAVRANPRTAAEGQRAMDDIRAIWGDEADRWFGKAPLN